MADRLRSEHRGPTQRRTWIARVLAGLIVATTVVAMGSSAGAHSGIQSYVYLSLSDSEVDGRVEYPVADLAEVLDLDFPDDGAGVLAVALENADAIRAYTSEHLAIDDASGSWALSFVGDPTFLAAAGGYVQVPFTVERSFEAAPRSFEVSYDGIIHANPERDALFIIENDWGTGTFNNEGEFLVGFSVGLTTQGIQLEDVGVVRSVEAARGIGTEAVRDRADLMLFVVAVLVPVALVSSGGRPAGPAPRAGAAIRRALQLLAVLILSSSVVTWVFGLGGVDWSDDLVRSLVAASLLVLAVVSLRPLPRFGGLVVGALGAVQGIAYADAYLGAHLDRVDNPLTLLGFTIGTSLALAAIAVLVFPVLLVVGRVDAAPKPLYGLAAVIAVYGLVWLVEAATPIGLASNWITAPIEVWPRNLIVLLLVWMPAAGWYVWASGRGALRPVEGGQPASEVERSVVTS
ncbi:MAG: HupE/UreJ family protein [Actinomycetota bacterium]